MRNVIPTTMMLTLSTLFLATTVKAENETSSSPSSIVQYGEMHQAIGMQKHHGRVKLSDLTQQPHFYGVGALEKLEGEVTILDGNVLATTVDPNGKPVKLDHATTGLQATMLVGAYVADWSEETLSHEVPAKQFDQFIADSAKAIGIDTTKPFLFKLDGTFVDIRLHVIKGACPLHARMQKIDLPPEQRPFEVTLNKIEGTVIGVYAKDAVGKLTHPATSVHMHLVVTDQNTGQQLTGHVEKVSVAKGGTLSLPRP